MPLLLGDAALGIPAELAHVVAERWLALLGIAAVGVIAMAWRLTAPSVQPDSPIGSSSPTGSSPPVRPQLEPGNSHGTIAWLVVGGIGGTVLGAAGFPSGRVLLIPDLAFAALLGLVLYRGLFARWPGRILAAVLAIIHLVIAPLATLRTVARLEHRGRATEAIAERVLQVAPPSARVFVVAASDPMVFLYPRGILAQRDPGAVRCWSVWSAARAGHRITRTGDRTLEIEPIEHTLLDGSFDELYRSPDRPFAAGDGAEQCGATIRVVAVRDGRPARLEVTLLRSFHDPLVSLLVWRDQRLERFTLPRLGETVEVPWSPGPSRVL